MNSVHRDIRALISVMAPDRAISYIQSFHLPEDEEKCLVEKEVRRKSYTQIAAELSMSPETIKRNRRRAFTKIADAIKNQSENCNTIPSLKLVKAPK